MPELRHGIENKLFLKLMHHKKKYIYLLALITSIQKKVFII